MLLFILLAWDCLVLFLFDLIKSTLATIARSSLSMSAS
ncbi:hypothetical protein SynBIOSE41_02314 [Synechococcus sp. BIOS-E4-1]|nr:hypothetical protein SynBIOSE41_02314 [Synechococcus sp. BIOS-E4-1]